MSKLLNKIATYTLLVATAMQTPLYASHCSDAFSTTVDAVRAAHRNRTPLVDNSCNPPRLYGVIQLTDTLASVQGSEHVTFSSSTIPATPNAPLHALIQRAPQFDGSGMSIPGTGEPGVFRAEIQSEHGAAQ